jgi:hypothetical protein
MESTGFALAGTLCFGVVVGWITYRTLRRRGSAAQLSDVSAVVAAVGGGVVTTLPFDDPDVFGAYAVGLAVGFFAYVISAVFVAKRAGTNPGQAVNEWMGD